MAFEFVAADDAQMQRHLAVGAAVFQGDNLAVRAAIKRAKRSIVEILGHDADRYPALRHGDTVNAGAHTIHTGPLTPSALVFNAVP